MLDRTRLIQIHSVTLLAAFALSGAALAEGERHVDRVPPLPLYQQECSSCHIAYPPRLLPAASWKQIMTSLPRHYGSDASLDAASVDQLSEWLEANAGSGRRARETPPENRITRSSWFIAEHDEVPTSAWKRATVKSAANCVACHIGADKGNFDEHSVHIPR